MSGKFSNVLLISDIDGTLMGPNGFIAQRNLDALHTFTSQGGHFTVASGRSFVSAKPHVARLPLTSPGIHFNGGCIYDFDAQKALYAQYLPDCATDYIAEILRDLPFVGVCILTDTNYYYVSLHTDKRHYYNSDNVPLTDSDSIHCLGRAYKVLLACSPEEMELLKAYLAGKHYEDVYFVASSPTYLEMMPQGVTKAQGVKKFIELFGYQQHYLVTAGDFHNDIPMLQLANFSATPSDAQNEVKRHADVTVCSCLDGAIADLIELIANKNI